MLTPLSNLSGSAFAETSILIFMVKPYMNSSKPPKANQKHKMADTYCCMVTDIAKKLINANTLTL